jgi:hypothetical protein
VKLRIYETQKYKESSKFGKAIIILNKTGKLKTSTAGRGAGRCWSTVLKIKATINMEK